jgi:hypothetical protein
MNYTHLDPILQSWARCHKLHVYTKGQGEDIRSVDIIGNKGNKCQLWITLHAGGEIIAVHLWNYKAKRRCFETSINNLHFCLEEAYATAQRWISVSPPVAL